jgi:hypothetical protein
MGQTFRNTTVPVSQATAMLYTAKPGVDHDKFRERIMCNMMHDGSSRRSVIITTDMPLQDVASVSLFVLRIL